GGLRVEEALALAARVELLERGQVDCAELGDRGVDARDLALQAGRARRVLGRRREHRLVGARLAKLGVELLEAELRRLLLEPQLAQALAQRSDARLNLEATLLELAQGARGGFDRVARLAQRLFARDARLDCAVELLAQRRNGILGELF